MTQKMTQKKYCICEKLRSLRSPGVEMFSQIQYFSCVINHI